MENKDFTWTSEPTKGNRQTITITYDMHNRRQKDLAVAIIGLCNSFKDTKIKEFILALCQNAHFDDSDIEFIKNLATEIFEVRSTKKKIE